ARAAETRGAWDARLEALVVDALVRGEVDDDLPSRAAALGWKPGPTLVVVGRTDGPLGETQSAELRRSMRRAATGAMVGIHGEDLIVIARSDQDLRDLAANILESFGPGPVVIGPPAVTLLEVARSTRAAFAGVVAAPAWSLSPRPVLADDLLPERVLVGDTGARDRLIAIAYDPIVRAGGSLQETVATFLDCGRSLELSARTMFVHANTVRYRLKKVSELTGWDVLSTRDAHVLETAFALGRLRDAGRALL
ncbi:MAG: PucR family transcriptional regulator, partial [Demequinaceae bacterium]|nr:PucR family transcriptional regulator [Demequinaceae bacterium]